VKRDSDEFTIVAVLLLPFTILWAVVTSIVSLIRAIQFSPARQEAEAQALNQSLYEEARKRYRYDLGELKAEICGVVSEYDSEYRKACIRVVEKLWRIESYGVPLPPAVADSIEGARYRDTLSMLTDLTKTVNCLSDAFSRFGESLPERKNGITFDMDVSDNVTGEILEGIIFPFFRDGVQCPVTRKQLNQNLEDMSGIVSETSSKPVVKPGQYHGSKPILGYIENTALTSLFSITIPFTVPPHKLFEHVHIVGSTGTGKTQLIQTLVAQQLQTNATIIVMAPKGKMIPTISRLASIEPERLILVQPDTDIALNIFNIGIQGDVENTVSLINYVFTSILEAAPTPRQTNLLNRLIRLLLVRPNSTLLDMRELLKATALPDEYKPFVDKLSSTSRDFFYDEFPRTDKDGYKETKSQLMWRIDLLLENPNVARLFSQPETRFNLFREIEQGKIILIDTSIKAYSEMGSAFLGRFFIALVALASQQRDLDAHLRPVYFYIDEASTYLDERIEAILERAREARVSLTLAHQQVEQLSRVSSQLKASVIENTSTKFMATSKPLHFSLSVRGVTEQPISITVSPGHLEGMDKRTDEAMEALYAMNRDTYGHQEREEASPDAEAEAIDLPYPKHEPAPLLKVAETDDDELEKLNKI